MTTSSTERDSSKGTRGNVTANFAVIGAAGYIVPRHLKAIQDTGNRLVAAVDPHDSVGILDRFSHDVCYFCEIERFDQHLDKLHRGPEEKRVSWVSICSPNYLHDSHVRIALRDGANAICEKPIVINPWNLDALEVLERETGRRVFTVLQLRTHRHLIALRERLYAAGTARRHQVNLTYVASRGPWYHVSWKGTEEKSGGIATNIGIHLFDLLIWFFGSPGKSVVTESTPSRMSGEVELGTADVRWLLSVDRGDLPPEARPRPHNLPFHHHRWRRGRVLRGVHRAADRGLSAHSGRAGVRDRGRAPGS
jgi:UDP-N-acetyl-2-amino-2-deoxyglucuronate dehydrogenase